MKFKSFHLVAIKEQIAILNIYLRIYNLEIVNSKQPSQLDGPMINKIYVDLLFDTYDYKSLSFRDIKTMNMIFRVLITYPIKQLES